MTIAPRHDAPAHDTGARPDLTTMVEDLLSGAAGNAAGVSVNALACAAALLAERNPPLCRRLIEAVVTTRTGNGGLSDRPGRGRGGTAPRTAWPVWAGIVEQVQRTTPDRDWGRRMWPRLRQRFLASVDHFDPEKTGLPAWRSSAEAWDPASYRPGVASPELPVLLLLEADALERLQGLFEIPDDDGSVAEARELLADGLLDFLADPEHQAFTARRIGGAREATVPRLAVFPLLWPDLPGPWVGSLLARLPAALAALRDAPPDLAGWMEIRLWQLVLPRLGAWGLQASLARIERQRTAAQGKTGVAEPSASPVEHRLAAALIDPTPRRPFGSGPGGWRAGWRRDDGRAWVAIACLLLALFWGIGHREPGVDAVTLSLWRQEALAGLAMGDPAAADEILAASGEAGVFAPYGDWLALRRAAAGGHALETVTRYEQWMAQDGPTPPVLAGLARAHAHAGRRPAARSLWQTFLDRHAASFPAAARAVRATWWQWEQRWAMQGKEETP